MKQKSNHLKKAIKWCFITMAVIILITALVFGAFHLRLKYEVNKLSQAIERVEEDYTELGDFVQLSLNDINDAIECCVDGYNYKLKGISEEYMLLNEPLFKGVKFYIKNGEKMPFMMLDIKNIEITIPSEYKGYVDHKYGGEYRYKSSMDILAQDLSKLRYQEVKTSIDGVVRSVEAWVYFEYKLAEKVYIMVTFSNETYICFYDVYLKENQYIRCDGVLEEQEIDFLQLKDIYGY